MALARGIRNNNPMNIRKGNNWIGERKCQTDSDFEEFTSMLYGLRAALKLIMNYISPKYQEAPRYDTICKIINRWAPPSENDTSKYVDFVAKRSGINADERISINDKKKLVAIIEAMCVYESGYYADTELIESAYFLLVKK